MKKFIGLILSAAMLLGTLPIMQASAESAANLAGGAVVTITGHNADDYSLPQNTAKLTDGDTETDDTVSGYWQTDAEADLGSGKNVSEIKLYRTLWHSEATFSGHTANILVKISADGLGWNDLGVMEIETLSATDTVKTQILTTKIANKNVRYIKLEDTDVHNGTQNQMKEIIVTPGWDNLAEGRTVTRTGYSYDGDGNKSDIKSDAAATMTDGDITNYSGISGAFHMDLEVDLGETKSIKEAKLYRQMIYYAGNMINDARVALEVSEDGNTWNTVGTMVKAGDNPSAENTTVEQVLTLSFGSVKARYVRFVETDNHNGIAMSPSEIILTEARNNVAKGGSVTFYSDMGNTDTGNADTGNADTENVIDGNYSTAASGNGAWAYHTVLQLDKKYIADSVRVVFGNDDADTKELKVFVSADGINYTSAGMLTKVADKTFDVSFKPQVVKAVKIFDLTGWVEGVQYSIAEIEVYEADAAYAVTYSVGANTTDTLTNDVIKAEVISGKLADGVMITALSDKNGKMISGSMADLADGAASTDTNAAAAGEIAPRANIAKGKPAYMRNVSNTADQGANTPYGQPILTKKAEYLTDDDPTTYAMGSGEFTGMMKVDLGAEYDIGEIVVDFMKASDKYEIAVSTDDSTYTTLYTETDINGGVKHYKVNGQKARYIGVFNKTTQNIQHKIAEIKVYQPTTELFKLRTFVWSSVGGENSFAPLGDVAELTN